MALEALIVVIKESCVFVRLFVSLLDSLDGKRGIGPAILKPV